LPKTEEKGKKKGGEGASIITSGLFMKNKKTSCRISLFMTLREKKNKRVATYCLEFDSGEEKKKTPRHDSASTMATG